MFFDRLVVNAVSAKSIHSTPTSPKRTPQQNALLGLAAAMALPAIGWAGALRAAEAPAPLTAVLAADQALSDADLLKQGMEQYKNGQYEEAVTSLQRVKKDSLSDAEKKQLDESLATADSAAKERVAARSEFEKGQEAFNGKSFTEATQHFKAAKENKFADAGTRDKADAQMSALQAVMAQSGTDSKSIFKRGRDEYRNGDWIAARKDLASAQDLGYKPGFLEPSPAELIAKMDAKEQADAAKAMKEAQASSDAAAKAKADAEAAAKPVAPVPAPIPVQVGPVGTASTDAKPADVVKPAEVVVEQPTADTKAEARAAYLRGRGEYRSGDWIAARKDLEMARDKGYKAGLFEDSADKYLSRMDAKEQADAAKAMKDTEAKATAEMQAKLDAEAKAKADAEAMKNKPTEVGTNTPPVVVKPIEVKPGDAKPGDVKPADAATPVVTAAPSVDQQLAGTARVEEIKKQQNAYEAKRLVEKAISATSENRKDEAIKLYSQALVLDPDNAAAQAGRTNLLVETGTNTAPTGNGVSKLAIDVEARKQAVNYQVDQALGKVGDDLRTGGYVDARKQIDIGRTVVLNERSLFTNDELSGFESRFTKASRDVEVASATQSEVDKRKAEEQAKNDQENATKIGIRERERTVHDLILASQQLIREAKFEAAQGTLSQILSLDPQNDYALGVKPLVEDRAFFKSIVITRSSLISSWSVR